MNFISYSFIALYIAALIARWGIPFLFRLHNNTTATNLRLISLLTLSWIFYAWHIPWYILLILASTIIDYSAANAIQSTPANLQPRRKIILALSLITNIGLLAYFKYSDFLVTSFNEVAGSGLTVPDILLPIGISFYTFQSMSYTIDVYQGKIAAEKSFTRVACYIAFFPQLIAGPIVRANEFLYQFDRKRRFHLKNFLSGAYLILRGLFLKMVVADNLGRIIDQHWAQASQEGQYILALTLLVFFACQLFCDFAGYVDIARGVAYQLGFRLPINFNAPYIATTFSGFWQRWHITLSEWLRDYVYIPLGGNRKGRYRTYLNLFMVLIISGLWHGSNWTFIAWSGMLGLALIVERAIGIKKSHGGLILTLFWFLIVQLTWIFSMSLFRATDIEEGRLILQNAFQGLSTLMFNGFDFSGIDDLVLLGWWFTLPVWLMHLHSFYFGTYTKGMLITHERSIYAGVMLAAVLVLYSNGQQFIYFQF